ncbi:MAG: Type 1 glutamine amidotransferase-like domain-containing protein, partial [Proteobacteria bacterium]|nr:Type 1 glutamine amidotransferase-like domain-containing protein [Pseudomonadota bacterium]
MCPAPVEQDCQRGFIVPIGGGEDQLRDREILSRYLEMCGGSNAHIVVIPTASELDDTGARYQDLFRELGAGEVGILHCDDRKECNSQDFVDLLDRADGIFMT